MAVLQTEREREREREREKEREKKYTRVLFFMLEKRKKELLLLALFLIVIFTFSLNGPNETSSWFLSVRRSLGQQRTRREEDRFHPRPSRVGWSRMFEVVLRRIVRQRFFIRAR